LRAERAELSEEVDINFEYVERLRSYLLKTWSLIMAIREAGIRLRNGLLRCAYGLAKSAVLKNRLFTKRLVEQPRVLLGGFDHYKFNN
jgi:hypothetical protein